MDNKTKLERMMENPVLYIETFMKINDKDNNLVPFILNKQQRELIENMEKFNIVCKGRQQGISSAIMGLCLYKCLSTTKSNQTCILLSYSLSSSKIIYEKLLAIYKTIPSYLIPKETAHNRSTIAWENGNSIQIGVMGMKDQARGGTTSVIWISEMSSISNQDVIPKQLLALENTMTSSSRLIIESTPIGCNEFYKMVMKAEQKENLYKLFYFPFHKCRDMFTTEIEDYSNRYYQINSKHLEEEELDSEEKILFDDGTDLQFLEWRRIKIKNSSLEEFHQEFSSNLLECFSNSQSANIFNSVKILESYNRASKCIPIDVNKIANFPNELKVYAKYIKIWDLPKNGEKYWGGVDSALGIGKDFTVLSILNDNCEQVAEFRSNKLETHIQAKIINALGRFYNKCLICTERKSNGVAIIEKLKVEFNYRNQYKMKEFDIHNRATRKLGWNPTEKSKLAAVSSLQQYLSEDSITIRSLNTLKEMQFYVFSEGKMGNSSETKNDDGVVSIMLALVSFRSKLNYLW